MIILLRLIQYFVDDKKKIIVEKNDTNEEREVSEILKHILNM